MAALVVNDLPLLHGAGAIQAVGLHEGRSRGVDLHFERNTELFAVAQNRTMNGGNARRAGVQVLSFLPTAMLRGAIGKLDLAAVPDGPVSAAGTLAGFEESAVEAGF